MGWSDSSLENQRRNKESPLPTQNSRRRQHGILFAEKSSPQEDIFLRRGIFFIYSKISATASAAATLSVDTTYTTNLPLLATTAPSNFGTSDGL